MLTMGHLLLLLLIDVLLLGELSLVLKRSAVLNHTVNNDLLAEGFKMSQNKVKHNINIHKINE